MGALLKVQMQNRESGFKMRNHKAHFLFALTMLFSLTFILKSIGYAGINDGPLSHAGEESQNAQTDTGNQKVKSNLPATPSKVVHPQLSLAIQQPDNRILKVGEALPETGPNIFQVKVWSPGKEEISYAWENAPESLKLDSKTGMITGTPTKENVGNHLIDVTVKHGEQVSVFQFTLTVQDKEAA